MNSVLVSLFEPTSENARVLIIKHYVDAIEAAALLCVLPVAFVALGLRKELQYAEFAPVAEAILVFPEALGTNALLGNRALFLEPVNWNACVKLAVIVGL